MSPGYRNLIRWARLLHLYFTLFGLVLILFFAITGLMLNHEDWFGLNEPRSWTVTGTLARETLSEPVDRLAVVEALRAHHGASGAVTLFTERDEDIEVEFIRPGARALARIAREDGALTMELEARGVVGILTDLHKGKNAGWIWALIIDASCVLLLIISLTGLILWWSLKSRGRLGAIIIVLGGLLATAAYFVSIASLKGN